MAKYGIAYAVLIILTILFFVLVATALHYRSKLLICENSESPYCYSLQCPAGGIVEKPCYGFAQRTAADGTILCSFS